MRTRMLGGPALALALVVGLVLGTAACTRSTVDSGVATAVGAERGGGGGVSPGGGGPGGGAPAPADRNDVDDVDLLGWVRCLRQQGVPVDDPAEPGGKPYIHEDEITPEKLTAAADACRTYNPNFGKPHPPMSAEDLAKWRRYAKCMRAHGVDMADPQPGAARPPIPLPPRHQDSSGFVRALQECGKQVPGSVITVEGTDGPKGR